MAKRTFNPAYPLHILAAAALKAEDKDLELVEDSKLKEKTEFVRQFAAKHGINFEIGRGGALRAEENSLTKELDRALVKIHSRLDNRTVLQQLSNVSINDSNVIKKLTSIAENAIAFNYFGPQEEPTPEEEIKDEKDEQQ